jgi:hypothetical protein
VNSEQLTRIEQKLDGLATDVGTLKTDVGTLKTDVGTLKTDVRDLQLQVADQRVHMGALHEEALSQIQQVAEGHRALGVQIAKGFEGLHAVIYQRLEPLEEMVRRHEAELNRRRQ